MNLKTNLTLINFTKGRIGQTIKYIVIHYTANNGDTAKGNSNYFHSVNRSASAHYFVDENEVVQVVKDSDTSWHCALKKDKNGNYIFQGNSGHTYAGLCTNSNSIGIEMCSDKVNGKFVITEETQRNTIELVRILMKKYNIPIKNVIRHYDVTGKICPEPFVRDESQWNEFKKRIARLEEEEMVKRYDKVNELPKSLQAEVQELVNIGALKGDENGNLNITEDMARCLIINKRYTDNK